MVYKLEFAVLRSRLCLLFFSSAAILAGPIIALPQTPYGVDGIPVYTVQIPVPMGFVSATTGHLHLEIPIASIPERNHEALVAKLVYEGISGSPGSGSWILLTGTPNSGTGNYAVSSAPCDPGYPIGSVSINSGFSFTDFNGTVHATNQSLFTKQYNCKSTNGVQDPNTGTPSTSGIMSDGSGYGFFVTNYTQMQVVAPDGTLVYDTTASGYGPKVPVDTNGNYENALQANSAPDTLGRTPFTISTPNNSCDGGPAITVRASDGTPQTYTFNCTLFNTSWTAGGTTFVQQRSFLTSIGLPDGTQYSLTYDTGNTPTHLGQLLTLTLPTGGQIAYTYTPFGFTINSCICSSGVASVAYGGGTWNLSYTNNSTQSTTITLLSPPRFDATSNTNVRDTTIFNSAHDSALNPTPFLQSAQYYSGSSTLLKTVTFGYDSNFLPLSVNTTLGDTGQSSTVSLQYLNGMRDYITQKQETDFSGNIVRTTKIQYNGPSNKPSSVNVYAGSGTGSPISSTLYTYDEYSASYCKNGVPMLANVTGATNHDDSGHGNSFTGRGNVTTIQRLISGTTYATTHKCYDTLGNVTQIVDADGNPTSFSYGENWADTNCIPSGTNTHAFPTTVTDSLGHQTGDSFYSCTSLRHSAQDPNDLAANRTGTAYTYDGLARPLGLTFSDGGSDSYSYTDASPSFSVVHTKAITSSLNLSETSIRDALGRPGRTQLTSDPDGTTYTDTTYDALGHVASASNPYRSTGEATYGITSSAYDALGRVTQVTKQDGQVVTTSYSGNCTTVTDEAGKARKSYSDALGRLTQVFEDPAGLNYETDYAYDALDNLLTVTQKGGTTDSSKWRVRTFAYDSLSRLASATNPESGTVTYAYDANGNVTSKTSLAPNQTGTATVTVSYCYDALNRLTSKAYTAQSCPMSSPVATYSYDQTSFNGLTITNGIGRRTGMTDQAGSEAWSYDSMGRVATDRRTTNGVTFNTPYTYNLDGSIATIAYPGPLPPTVTLQPGGTGRPIAESSTDPATYATGVHYAPNGSLCFYVQGWGIESSMDWTFNNRFQPTRIYMLNDYNVTPPTPCTNPSPQSGVMMDLVYSYADANGHNNGNVASISDNVDPDRSQVFSYDSLNRIATAKTLGINQPTWSGDTDYMQDCWGEQFGYDPWGNLLSISSLSSSYTGCTQENLSVAASTKNQIVGDTYDAAGNLIIAQPGNFQYTFDAENHLIATAGQTYLYDGDGKRVEKATSGTPPAPNKLYWYDQAGNSIYESDAAGNELYRYYYFAGRLVAREEANDWVDHYGTDALGNVRYLYSLNGAEDLIDYYPFGGERLAHTTSAGNNTRLFTGKERDPESGLDNFGARYYGSSLGRFMRPDDPNIDQDPADPQSWNLYAYVRNNPLTNTDPTGNACVSTDGGKTFYDDDRGGQSCKEAQEPQKVQVKEPTLPHLPMDTLTMLICRSCPAPPFDREAIEHPLGAPVGPIGPIGSLATEAAEELTVMARFSAILRAAAASKGMGPATGKAVEVTAAEAEELGKAWVGSGGRVASDGKTLVSKDGLRIYRPPTFKPGLGKMQANLEQKPVSGSQPSSNFHLDIK